MKVVIAGGTGLIGSAIAQRLKARGDVVKILTTKPIPPEGMVSWDGRTVGAWSSELTDADAVVNLSGSPISVKWTDQAIKQLYSSRIEPTQAIGQALSDAGSKARWIQGSAVGYYGNRGDEMLPETAAVGSTFLAELASKWEQAAVDHCPAENHLCRIRTGIALANEGGSYPIQRKLAAAFLGGHPGSGKQFISWIHIDDLADLVVWAIDREAPSILNGSAPNPTTMEEFCRLLRESVGRPWSPPVPEFALKIANALGAPDPSVLLDSTRAVPQAAMDHGFEFKLPQLKDAFRALK